MPWKMTETPSTPQSEKTSGVHQLPLFAKELLAGGLAGGIGKTCVAPLERVKILFQTGRMQDQGVAVTLREIYSTEGLPGFFKGNGVSVMRIVPYAAVHFGAYEWYRHHLVKQFVVLEHPQQLVNPVWDLLAGSAAGGSAVMLTYPLDLVRTRLAYSIEGSKEWPAGKPQSEPRSSCSFPPKYRLTGTSISGMLRSIVQREGARGLYHGIGPTLCGIMPYAGLKFYVYQSLKQKYREYAIAPSGAINGAAAPRLPIEMMLSFGALSGLIAQTVTYPLDVVRRRMQVEGLKKVAAGSTPEAAIKNTWDGLVSISQAHGVRALFAGISINFLKVVPSTAVGFALYDALKSYLGLPSNL